MKAQNMKSAYANVNAYADTFLNSKGINFDAKDLDAYVKAIKLSVDMIEYELKRSIAISTNPNVEKNLRFLESKPFDNLV